MTHVKLNLPSPGGIDRILEFLRENAYGYDNNEVRLKVEEVDQEFYTVLHEDGYYEQDEGYSENSLDHTVFATQAEAEQYYTKTLQIIQDHVKETKKQIVEYTELLKELKEPVTPGEFDPSQELSWEEPRLTALEKFLKHLVADGVQHHYGTIPVYTITYPAWAVIDENDLKNIGTESIGTVETKKYMDFFLVKEKLLAISEDMFDFATHSQNIFGYETYEEAYAQEAYLQKLSSRYTMMQLYATRTRLFSYKDLRKIMNKNRKSSEYTPEQIDRMFDNYPAIQAWLTRTIFETFLNEGYEHMDWFIAAFDIERFREEAVQYVHNVMTEQITAA